MINTCDPDIATWSDDGKSFIVKDPDALAYRKIPLFFKHNKFSSFVRQLNFYGFHKIKIDQDDDSINESTETKRCGFYHDKFIRGRPDLLIDIRRANNHKSSDHQGVELLRAEVKTLKECVSSMSDKISSLTSLLNQTLKRENETPENTNRKTKKRRLEGDQPSSSTDLQPQEISTEGHITYAIFDEAFSSPEKASDEELLLEEVDTYSETTGRYDVGPLKPETILPNRPCGREESFISIATADPDYVDILDYLERDESALHDNTVPVMCSMKDNARDKDMIS